MSASTYINTLKQSLDFLFTKHGFRVTFHLDSESFGNKYTLLESDDLIIAVLRDRNLISLDIRHNDGRAIPIDEHYKFFFDFLIVLRALNAPEEKELELLTDDTDEGQLRVIAKALETHYSRILAMFGPGRLEEAKKELRRLEEERADELLGMTDDDY